MKTFFKTLSVFVIVTTFLLGSYFGINFFNSKQQVIAAEGDKYKALESFGQTLSLIESSYVDEVEEKEIIYGAIKGMLQSLDPHSTFFTPETYKSFKIGTTGSFGGLGITIGMRDEMITIISPIDDTPADKAGVKSGDIIIKIEDESTMGMTLEDATSRMRGKPGTKINITLARKGENEPIEMVIVRDIIKIKSVKYEKIDDIGYIRLAQFQDSSTKEMLVALKALEKENVKGYIFDLRNNSGGLLAEAINISSLFLEKDKTVVYTQDRSKKENHFKTRNVGFRDIKKPIIMIVNEGSASASEILAGAFQDYDRALVIGTNTFGKASVQSIIEMSDGSAVKLTTARYYTPLGRSIQGTGVKPDIIVESGTVEIDKSQRFLKESDLANHLVGENEKKKDKKDKSMKGKKDDKKKSSEIIQDGDYQLMSAMQLLNGIIKYGKTNN